MSIMDYIQHNSESFRQDEFKGEPAERIKIREQRRSLQNSLVSSFMNYAVRKVDISLCVSSLVAIGCTLKPTTK